MHTGPAIERGGDWFGATVKMAARVSGLAGGGEVLLTEATMHAAGHLEKVELASRGHHSLKNVASDVSVYIARRSGRTDTPAVDPVCRMAVDLKRCAGRLRHEGVEYHFCSLDCVQQFAEDPARFASAR